MRQLVATCVWRISDDLIHQLDTRFGDPADAYVNGSQTWLRDDGPGGATLEWRLHPVARYEQPAGITSHYDVFPTVAFALASGEEPTTDPASLWDGLEAFPAYDDEVEPAQLAACTTEALGIAPDVSGLVDHDRIADTWERTGRSVSIIDALLDQLTVADDGDGDGDGASSS